MSALEQEILDKIQLLDRPAKQRVFDLLARELTAPFDIDAWLRDVAQIREEIALRTGNPQGVSVMDLLDELRDEAS